MTSDQQKFKNWDDMILNLGQLFDKCQGIVIINDKLACLMWIILAEHLNSGVVLVNFEIGVDVGKCQQ